MKVQQGIVFCNGVEAGIIQKPGPEEYVFIYNDVYFKDPLTKPISLTLPKTQQEYKSKYLFPFFSGLLSEGINREIQCRLLKIDEKDEFTLLLRAARFDTIGAITIKEIIINSKA